MMFRPKGKRFVSQSHRSQPKARHGYFKSFDGTKIFYSIEGQGRPLIFCYGLVCSSLHWTYQIDYLSQNYQCIWFDYRGHHNSETPSDFKALTIQNIAADLACLIDELKIENPVILGHSMGVNVVLELYRQRPDKISALVLANGTPKPPLETMFHNNLSQFSFPLLKRAYDLAPSIVKWVWKHQAASPLTKSVVALSGFNPHLSSRDDINLYIDQVASMDPGILFHLISNYENYDATSWLHQITVPTLIIAGENDHITPLDQQKLMHQLIPNSRLEMIKHGSHCPQMDLPELVNIKIKDFLNNIQFVSPEAKTSTSTLTRETSSQSTQLPPHFRASEGA